MITKITKIESAIAPDSAINVHNFLSAIVLGLIDAIGIAQAQNFAQRFEARNYSYCASVLKVLAKKWIAFYPFYAFCDDLAQDD